MRVRRKVLSSERVRRRWKSPSRGSCAGLAWQAASIGRPSWRLINKISSTRAAREVHRVAVAGRARGRCGFRRALPARFLRAADVAQRVPVGARLERERHGKPDVLGPFLREALVEPLLAGREPSDADRRHLLPGMLCQVRGVVDAAETERLRLSKAFASRADEPCSRRGRPHSTVAAAATEAVPAVRRRLGTRILSSISRPHFPNNLGAVGNPARSTLDHAGDGRNHLGA